MMEGKAPERGNTVPYSLEYDSLNRILRGRFEGHVTDDELHEYCRESSERIASIDPHAAVTDLSGVRIFEVTPQMIVELAETQPMAPGRDPLRVIIAESPHVFGLARMFELAGQRSHPNVHVVHTQEEASAVLGIEELHFKPCRK
jgi:hypothetical protein